MRAHSVLLLFRANGSNIRGDNVLYGEVSEEFSYEVSRILLYCKPVTLEF